MGEEKKRVGARGICRKERGGPSEEKIGRGRAAVVAMASLISVTHFYLATLPN